ncbi:protein rogdi-like [Pollicipes pollicipes]|uniref:protein rogdi-like n=1 Tax=Pollicipes pollicipes TaxID=41117 RepID=UPI001884E8F6|nr:protein rogdi-like [Pollicipes pollicipes]
MRCGAPCVMPGGPSGGPVNAADGEVIWFLSEEVFRSLSQIVDAIDDCMEAFPASLRADAPCAQERFVMQQAASQSSADTAKCVLVMEGAAIVQAELQVKIQKHPNMIHKTSIEPDAPWALGQLQDSANMLAELMLRLKRGRDCLLSPRKKTIEDHLNSENMKSLRPPLPGDIAVSFYVQGHRLMLAVYHLVPQQGSMRFDSFLAECVIAKLETVLEGYTQTFQMCQQIKNKLSWARRYHERARTCAPVAVQNGM